MPRLLLCVLRAVKIACIMTLHVALTFCSHKLLGLRGWHPCVCHVVPSSSTRSQLVTSCCPRCETSLSVGYTTNFLNSVNVQLCARFCCCPGLRDILLRTTSIKDLPTDIWTATNPMTCTAGPSSGANNLQGSNSAGAGGARNKLVLPALLGGTAALQVEPGSEPGWVKVTLSSSSSSGWLGFGVADPGVCTAACSECRADGDGTAAGTNTNPWVSCPTAGPAG
jgi:hypothetical protein